MNFRRKKTKFVRARKKGGEEAIKDEKVRGGDIQMKQFCPQLTNNSNSIQIWVDSYTLWKKSMYTITEYILKNL